MFLVVKKSDDIDTTYIDNKLTTKTCLVRDISIDCKDQYDGLIILGGDGTIIRTLHCFTTPPIVYAINFGTFGFLAPMSRSHTEEFVDALAQNTQLLTYTRKRMRINDMLFMNEVVFKSPRTKCSRFRISINNEDMCVNGDSVIISTRTGSTGYNNSIGGPFVAMDAIIINLVAPNKLNFRPIVCGIDAHVCVEVGDDDAIMVVDGVEMPYKGGLVCAADDVVFGSVCGISDVENIKKIVFHCQ